MGLRALEGTARRAGNWQARSPDAAVPGTLTQGTLAVCPEERVQGWGLREGLVGTSGVAGMCLHRQVWALAEVEGCWDLGEWESRGCGEGGVTEVSPGERRVCQRWWWAGWGSPTFVCWFGNLLEENFNQADGPGL